MAAEPTPTNSTTEGAAKATYDHVEVPADHGATNVLVTGVNGYVATHCVELLLSLGFNVIGSLRTGSFGKASAQDHLMKLPGAAERLTFVEANLDDLDSYMAACKGVHYVLHCASPYTLHAKNPQTELVDPAVNGTVSVLTAAVANRVARVVLTSSFAAVTDSPETGRVYGEEDFNVKSSLLRNPYYYSKVLAEKRAWKDADETGLDLVVINPCVVWGPEYSSSVNSSVHIVQQLLTGGYPAIVDISWNICDVRDVAAVHVAAMMDKDAKGRYLTCAGSRHLKETVAFLRASGYSAYKLPSLDVAGPVGNWFMYGASYFQPGDVGGWLRTHLGQHGTIDSTKARDLVRKVFQREFISPDQSLLETVENLLDKGVVARIVTDTATVPPPASAAASSSSSSSLATASTSTSTPAPESVSTTTTTTTTTPAASVGSDSAAPAAAASEAPPSASSGGEASPTAASAGDAPATSS